MQAIWRDYVNPPEYHTTTAVMLTVPSRRLRIWIEAKAQVQDLKCDGV